MRSLMCGFVLCCLCGLVLPVFANDDIYVRGGGHFQPVSIAILPFFGDGAQVSDVVASDMARSIFLQPANPATFPERPADPDRAPNWELWKTINVQFVLTGRVENDGGSLKAHFRLWDVASGQQVAGEELNSESSGIRRIAHGIADRVFTRVTGYDGFFDSRVVFIDETGGKQKRVKRVALMDMDGGNVKYLTQGDRLVVTPTFSPNNQQIAFMAFGRTSASVTVMDLESGAHQSLGPLQGMSFAPRFSPDGQHVVMSLSSGANASLYEMDLGSHALRRLTEVGAIDTSPSYSPDGSQIIFESDRGGSQQLYVMPTSGGEAHRISFGQGRYSTPIWSPKGDLIAFTRQKDGNFAIGVMKPDGTGERILTEGFHNEGPTFSPNGLFVMFFRDPGGLGGAHIHMADIFGHGEFVVPTPAYASDPSWGPLLK